MNSAFNLCNLRFLPALLALAALMNSCRSPVVAPDHGSGRRLVSYNSEGGFANLKVEVLFNDEACTSGKIIIERAGITTSRRFNSNSPQFRVIRRILNSKAFFLSKPSIRKERLGVDFSKVTIEMALPGKSFQVVRDFKRGDRIERSFAQIEAAFSELAAVCLH